ncbi:MAG: hypothetical protein V8Q54_10655 [Alistipes senegalensis]
MAGQYVSQPVWSGDGSGLEKGQEIRGFVPATVHADQTDIVIARTEANSATYGKGQPVKLNFRHILSQVSFKAKKRRPAENRDQGDRTAQHSVERQIRVPQEQ